MRLQRQVNRVVEDKEYSKYVLIVPPEDVEKLGWKEGEELAHEVKEESLIISKAKPPEEEVIKTALKYAKRKEAKRK
jgi:bifunctional DNA-binding transcriptional regulator/antitoxin component of YhaV-PrlF toxin-antitoxin module